MTPDQELLKRALEAVEEALYFLEPIDEEEEEEKGAGLWRIVETKWALQTYFRDRFSTSLSKVSNPGWEKKYDTGEEVKAALYASICDMCRKGEEGGPPVDETSTISAMLSTPCGCEFVVE